MRLFSLASFFPFALLLFLAPSASTANGSSRAADAILSDIYRISSLLASLTRKVTPLSITPAPPASSIQSIRSALQDLIGQMETSNLRASSAPQLDDAASAAIANAIADLKDAAFAALDALKSRHVVFDAASAPGAMLGFVSSRRFVRADLVALREATTDFGGNLTTKLVRGVRIAAPLVVGDLHWHFTRVIDVMS